MFNRSMKLTSIIVAAASVISSVPVMASTRLASKDGTVDKGVAYKDGRYIYQGYRTDEDDDALYYNNGTKDKKIDDAEELGEKYNDKYVDAYDGDTHYVIDLSSGKIDEDDTLDDLESEAQTRLENKLDDTDRYGKDISFKNNSSNTFSRVTNNKLDDIWYSYSVTTPGSMIDKFGFVDNSKRYIDTSYDLNLYSYYSPTTSSAVDAKMYKLDDVEDTQDVKDKDGNILTLGVSSVKFVKFLDQDDKYLYSIIKVGIKNGMDMNTIPSKVDDIHYSYYLQKVTKQQGDKEKDAYKPKNTYTYEISPNYHNSDTKDAYELLMKFIDKDNPGSYYDETAKISANNGFLYVTYSDGDDKVKTCKLILKNSQKLDRYNVNGSKESGKVDGHIVVKDGDNDTDISDKESWTIDSNGNVWAIDKGNIKKSVNGGEFKTIYTCDRSIDRLDVYDDDNLIAWDNDGGVYTTVTEGIKASQEEAEELVGNNNQTEVTEKAGWKMLDDGNWVLYDTSGNKCTGWINDNNHLYYLDKITGIMQVGWFYDYDRGAWYYLNPTSDGTKGAAKTGWIYDNAWYYLESNGAMKTGWLSYNGKWYYLQPNGSMKTGWLNDNGTWYYLYSDGSMAYDTTIDGYRVNSSGAWIG